MVFRVFILISCLETFLSRNNGKREQLDEGLPSLLWYFFFESIIMKVLDDCYAQSSYSTIKAPSNQLKILWKSINLGAKSFLSKYLETKINKSL